MGDLIRATARFESVSHEWAVWRQPPGAPRMVVAWARTEAEVLTRLAQIRAAFPGEHFWHAPYVRSGIP